MAKWLRFTGRPAPATHKALAIETKPPQVSGLPAAQIQWRRTNEDWPDARARDFSVIYNRLRTPRIKVPLPRSGLGGRAVFHDHEQLAFVGTEVEDRYAWMAESRVMRASRLNLRIASASRRLRDR
jgi:hypothetical protein